jgi:hypothetical protein
MPTAQGYRQRAIERTSRPPWLIRYWKVLILTIAGAAALIGNVEKLRDTVFSLSGRPAIAITSTRQQIDVLAGEEVDAEFIIRNVSDWVPCDLTLQTVRVEPSTAISVDSRLPGTFVGLKPGITDSVRLHGLANNSPLQRSAATAWIWFNGNATTVGHRTQDLSAESFRPYWLKLVVWPRRYVAIRDLGEILNGTKARLDCQFMIGDEFSAGFEALAQMDNVADVCFDRIQFPGNPELDWKCDEQLQRGRQTRWKARNIAPRKKYRFALYLKCEKPKTKEQWVAVSNNVAITFGSLPPAK